MVTSCRERSGIFPRRNSARSRLVQYLFPGECPFKGKAKGFTTRFDARQDLAGVAIYNQHERDAFDTIKLGEFTLPHLAIADLRPRHSLFLGEVAQPVRIP